MKKKIILIFACVGLLFLSCEKDLYQNQLNKNETSFTVKKVSLNQIPDIDLFIRKKISNFPFANKSNKTSKIKSSAIFDIVNILEVIDKENIKNYSLRFVFENTPENIYYNLIINVLPSGEKAAFVEKFTCNVSDFAEYKSQYNNFKYFKGTVELHKYTAFFDNQMVTNKTAEDCTPQYDQYGDPIPVAVSYVSGGSSTGGSSSTGGGFPTGSGTSLNVSFYGVSTNSYGSGNINNDCCECGNCGNHWWLPSESDDHDQKTTTDPCVTTIPTGTISVSNTASPFPCLTAAKLLEVFPNSSLENRNALIKIIKVYGHFFDINTNDEMLHFIAQVGAETGGLTTLNATEDLYYITPSAAVASWPSKFTLTNQPGKIHPEPYLRNPELLANFVYCCKLGNNGGADGWSFRGRGVLQLTGRENYQEYEEYLKSIGLGWFYTSPDNLSTIDVHAVLSGMWFFKNRVLNKMDINASTSADKVTRKVNKGTDTKSKTKRQVYLALGKEKLNC